MAKFHVLTTFTIHFTLCLIFIRAWPIEDFLFENRQIDKLHELYVYISMIHIYIHNKQNAQISQKQDGYNTCNHCLIITKMALWQLMGIWCMWCTVSFFIVYKNLLAKFCYMCIYKGYFRNWRQHLAIIQCC